MQPRVLSGDGSVLSERAFRDERHERVAFPEAEPAHAVQMRLEGPEFHEPRQCILLEVGYSAAQIGIFPGEADGKLGRQHHVAYAHSGGESLCKGVHVDDTAQRIDAFQC